MRLDPARLRARRLQLGLTMRGLAREAGISQTLVKRLEDTGEVDSLTCATLQRLIDALSVDVAEVLASDRVPASDEKILARLGPILLGRSRGISIVALANLLAIDSALVDEQLDSLAEQLRPVGIRVHRVAKTVSLTAASDEVGPLVQRTDLETASTSDLRLLHRVVFGKLHSRDVAGMKNGNVVVHRLIGAALAEINCEGSVVSGPTAQDVFQIGQV